MKKSPLILQDFTLPCGLKISNRILKSAMSEGFATSNHAPNDDHIKLYERFKDGGSGIVVTGNVMIDSQALGEPGNVVIEDERHLDRLKTWAQYGSSQTSKLFVQLNHPGKQSPRFVSKTPVAPSAIPLKGGMARAFKKPRALSDNEIKDLVVKFAQSAKIVKKAGFDGVQIHAAHGYLISQFLSPNHNQRSAPYGGSLENRMRFLIEIYEAIRNAVGPNYPVIVKMNASDFSDGGFTHQEALQVIQVLEEKGCDLIELSGGTYEKPVMMGSNQNEAYFLEFIKEIRENTKIPLAITGGFRSLSVMEAVLENKESDMIGLARPLVLDPDIPHKIKEGIYQSIALPRFKIRIKSLRPLLGPVLGLGAYEMALKDLARGKTAKISSNTLVILLKLVGSNGFKALIQKRSKK